MMSKRRYRACAYILAALIGVFIGLHPLYDADAGSSSRFIIECDYSHSRSDDPIVFPNQPGASHLHDFFGNRTTNANSTYNSLIGQATTCENPGDTAAYWVPAAFKGTQRILPTSIKAYYYKRFDTGTVAYDPGFKVVAGNSRATSPQSTSIVYFGCGSGSGLTKVNYLPNCTNKGKLAVHVNFPFCIEPNGALTYNSNCSGTRLPRLVMRVAYPIIDARTMRFSSGAYYTYHADFFNSWHQPTLEALVGSL